MLNGVVQLHDIKDAEAFVWGIIRKKLRMIDATEMEDMVAEGLLILCDLARLYDPERDKAKKQQQGHVCKGPRCCKPSFAGYANFLLPKKLKEAYYGKKPECMMKTNSDGTRSYIILERSVSIEDRNSSGGGSGGLSDDNSANNVVDVATTRHVGNFINVPEVVR